MSKKEMKPTHASHWGYFHVDGDEVFRLDVDYGWGKHYMNSEDLLNQESVCRHNGDPIRYDFIPTEGGMGVDINMGGQYIEWVEHKKLRNTNELVRNALQDAIDILEGIISDPTVQNVYKCHIDSNDIDGLKSVLNK